MRHPALTLEALVDGGMAPSLMVSITLKAQERGLSDSRPSFRRIVPADRVAGSSRTGTPEDAASQAFSSRTYHGFRGCQSVSSGEISGASPASAWPRHAPAQPQ